MLTVEQFGQQLIETGDLDPIYVMLNQSGLEWDQKARFCLSYWCFYHAGFAAYCAEAGDDIRFWDLMQEAAQNTTPCLMTKDGRWPRGTERRHFRGRASIASVAHLRTQYPKPQEAPLWLASLKSPPATLPFLAVREAVMKWPAFGPWIGFKVADMMDAVLGYNVDFTGTEQYFFDDPKEGARIVYEQNEDQFDSREPLQSVVKVLMRGFNDLTLPHKNAPLDTQSVETILCKYKSHTRGSYPVGKDTKEIIHGLGPWAKHSQFANHLKGVLEIQARKVGLVT